MSSTIATAARKTLSPFGARGATIARIPSAKAMSVAIAIAHPRAAAPPPLARTKIAAGTIIPPIAAAIGRAAWRGEASSPTRASRFTSRPTSRKKTAIRPSLIHW